VKFVEIYDFATATKARIPAPELAPGMVRVNLEGIGSVFVAGVEMDAYLAAKHEADSPAPVKRLPEGFDRIARATWAMLEANLPWMTEKAWLEGLLADPRPVAELVGWMKVIVVCDEMTRGQMDGPGIGRDLFAVAANALVNGEEALETVELAGIWKATAQVCMEKMLHVDPREFSRFWADRLADDDFAVLAGAIERGDG